LSASRQSLVGAGLALAIMAAWLALHVAGVFFYSFEALGWATAIALIAASCWLSVGLFIVAHDCMHGSLAPGRPALNKWIGRSALFVYAGFSFNRLRAKHFEHHRTPGTEHDPDFSADHPTRFWPWYANFFRQYFGFRELAILSAASAAYLLLGATYWNLVLFWALPAILSSLQLFLFGTFLPHRQANQSFADDHRARSNDYGWFASLLSCFHFGYHHEHHLAPHQPWWRLPGERQRRRVPAPPR
jgi:beta-carotene ketolase (CrtW type)